MITIVLFIVVLFNIYTALEKGRGKEHKCYESPIKSMDDYKIEGRFMYWKLLHCPFHIRLKVVRTYHDTNDIIYFVIATEDHEGFALILF